MGISRFKMLIKGHVISLIFSNGWLLKQREVCYPMTQCRSRPEEQLWSHPSSETLFYSLSHLICFIYAINTVNITKYWRTSHGALGVNLTVTKSVEKKKRHFRSLDIILANHDVRTETEMVRKKLRHHPYCDCHPAVISGEEKCNNKEVML